MDSRLPSKERVLGVLMGEKVKACFFGHRYDLFGRSEDETVDDLVMPEQFMGYWFSWGAFYPGLPLYD